MVTHTNSQRSGFNIKSGNFHFAGQIDDLTGSTTINDNIWHMLLATYDGSTLTLYVDGVYETSTGKSYNTVSSGTVLHRFFFN